MSYQIITGKNKYLYGRLEHCTLMMGRCIIDGNADDYKKYLQAKESIKEQIELNLELIEEIWHGKKERFTSAGRRSLNVNFRKEMAIINELKSTQFTSVSFLAKHYEVTEKTVENIIQKFYLAS